MLYKPSYCRIVYHCAVKLNLTVLLEWFVSESIPYGIITVQHIVSRVYNLSIII